MELEFVRADETDVAAICALAREHIETYEDLAAIDAEAVFAWMERKTRKRIGEYRRVTCLGETAGYFRAAPPENGRIELDDLYLYPPFQGRGIGTAILKKCIAEAPLPLYFYVFRRNVRAIALYEKLGFRIVGEVSPTRCIMQRG